jgi:hypothetical protein
MFCLLYNFIDFPITRYCHLRSNVRDLKPTSLATSVRPAHTSYSSALLVRIRRGTYVKWTTVAEIGEWPATTDVRVVTEISYSLFQQHLADSLIRPKPKEITQSRNWTLDFANDIVCSTLMDLTVADYYYVCCWKLTGESGFEHLEEGLAFLIYQLSTTDSRWWVWFSDKTPIWGRGHQVRVVDRESVYMIGYGKWGCWSESVYMIWYRNGSV